MIHVVLGLAADDKGNGWRELVSRTTVQGHEGLAIELEIDDQRSRGLRLFRPAREPSRVWESGDVEINCSISGAVKPHTRSDRTLTHRHIVGPPVLARVVGVGRPTPPAVVCSG